MTSDDGAGRGDGSRPEPPGRRPLDRFARSILPAPRDVAFANLVRSTRDLALGRRPQSVVDAERLIKAEERWRFQLGQELLGRGDPAGVVTQAERLERLDRANAGARALRVEAARTEPILGRASTTVDPADVVAAQAQLRAEGHDRPIVLLYHQSSPGSPFQTLLYRRAWARGIAPIPLHDLGDLPGIDDAIDPDTGRILHLHWVNRVLQGATDAADARRRIDAAAAVLDDAARRGWKIVWTVHNVLPHDAVRETDEAALRQAIADRASLVHVMASETAALAAPWYTIPAGRTIHVPLPSFRGAYADIVDRSAARYALGLPGDARVVSLVGGLRPYKGLDVLLEAFDRAVREHLDLHLVIAGSASPSPVIAAVVERAQRQPNVHLHGRLIPSDDIQLFMRASDAVVLPYVRTLNSALLMLALAFELPVIAPDLGAIPETVDARVATIFPAGNVEALAAALGSVRPVSAEVAAVARRISDEHDADRLSGELMSALRRIVDERPAAADAT